jgi:hypothetical protein
MYMRRNNTQKYKSTEHTNQEAKYTKQDNNYKTNIKNIEQAIIT